MKWFKIIVLSVVPVLAGMLIVLRITGLDLGHPSFKAYAEAGRSALPGLWLTGELAREPVTH